MDYMSTDSNPNSIESGTSTTELVGAHVETTLETKTNLKTVNGTNRKLDVVPKKSIFKEILAIVKGFLVLLKEIYVTWRKPRPGRARAYLLIITLVFSLHTTFETGVRYSIFHLYLQKSPFLWGANEMAYYNSFWAGMQLAGSLIGIIILKKFLKLSDTMIVIIVMLTHIIETVMLAFANTALEIYIAAAVGCLWTTLIPCVKSFMTQLVEPDEVGKSYILFGIATTLSIFLSGLMYGGIYMATVSWFAGFSFLLAGGLELICVAIMIWVHIDYKRRNK